MEVRNKEQLWICNAAKECRVHTQLLCEHQKPHIYRSACHRICAGEVHGGPDRICIMCEEYEGIIDVDDLFEEVSDVI